MKKTVFLVLGILILVVLGYQVFDAYLANHTYYRGTASEVGMLGSGANWKILIWSILFAAIPVSYILFFKKKSLKGFSIALFIGLFLYAVAESVVKQGILGPGFLLMLFKYVILFGIIIYFIVGLLSTGTWIRRKIFGSHDRSIEQIFLNIGLGLIAFCIINYVLILLHLFYGIIIALFFIAYGVCSRMMRRELSHAKQPMEDIIESITWDKMMRSPWMLIYVILMLLSIMYVYHGFVLADIPYPTAWDANHAYMYYPRIWALNNGYYWESSLAMSPQIWYGYITFRFKLMYIFGQNTWISADNLAVIMNFISAVFTLGFGLILIKEVVRFIHGNHDKNNPVFFIVGWLLLILWLTSGMGAFLVFVDNKTDLGVMALTILALYSGFFFINQLKEHVGAKHSLHYVILSGVFFAGAILAKPTATFDVINFTITLLTLWFGGILAFGIFLGIIGVLGKSAILTVQKFLSEAMVNQLLGAAGVVTVGGIVYTWFKKKWQNLRYLLIWGAVIAATLIIVKGPYLITKQLKIEQHFAPTKLIKDIFLAQNNTQNQTPAEKKERILLASTYDYKTLLAADVGTATATTETTGATATTSVQGVAACKAKDITKENLYKNLKEPPGSSLNEDVGRYIGYGWKTFNSPWWSFIVGNGCHAASKDAKILCENASVLEQPNTTGLQALYDKLPENSKGKQLLQTVVSSDANALQRADALKNVKAYYQDKSWYKEDGKVSLPYTALVPFNITFNWSLQNLTSYYTDIGVIWLLCLFIIIIGFIYSLVEWNKQLFAITLSTLGGWALWWVAGGAILWYSLGVVIWTIIATTLVLYAFGQNNNATQKKLFTVMVVVLAFIGLYQLLLNFIRISSQGGGGPFIWYRANVGTVTELDENLQQVSKQKIGYNAKDVFNLQFGHYNKAINILEAREDNEGVVVAGTYLPYFIRNQHGLSADGFLVDFRKNLSDNDPCNTYLRMQDMQKKFFVIDPNIASVVMGEANSSLLDRIFGKLDSAQNNIIEYGSMTMIAKMVREGYMSLAATNIISAKYAFELSPEELKAAFPQSKEEDIVLRAKLATLRFWPNAQEMFSGLPGIFNQRMISGKAVEDIADIMGKDVDVNKIRSIAMAYFTQKRLVAETLSDLSEDEKNVLVQYLSIYNIMKSDTRQYQQVVSNMIQQSILGNSQVMVFKLN